MRRIDLCIGQIVMGTSLLSSSHPGGVVWLNEVIMASSFPVLERGRVLQGMSQPILRRVCDFTWSDFSFNFPQKIMALQQMFQVGCLRRVPTSKCRKLC